jgi:hypothetical protein
MRKNINRIVAAILLFTLNVGLSKAAETTAIYVGVVEGSDSNSPAIDMLYRLANELRSNLPGDVISEAGKVSSPKWDVSKDWEQITKQGEYSHYIVATYQRDWFPGLKTTREVTGRALRVIWHVGHIVKIGAGYKLTYFASLPVETYITIKEFPQVNKMAQRLS